MNFNICCTFEGNTESNQENWAELRDILNKQGKSVHKFVGLFVSKKGVVHSILPKTFQHAEELTQEEKYAYTRQVYRVLRRYKRESKGEGAKEIKLNTMVESSDIKLSPFGIVDALLNDWFTNGLWRPTQVRQRAYGNSSINWSRTIGHSPAIVLDNSSLHHPMIHNHFHRADDHPLCRVQRIVLWDIIEQFGWLFPEAKGIQISKQEKLERVREDCIFEIYEHLPQIFNQRERDLFEWILMYLNESDAKGRIGTIHVFGCISFQTIFEKMLQAVLNDQSKDPAFKRIQSKPKWELQGEKEVVIAGSGGDADIVLSFREKVSDEGPDKKVPVFAENPSKATHALIVDAKYYDFENALKTGKSKYLPNLEDIRKQYFYADFVRNLERDGENKIVATRNTLLFPLSTPAKSKNPIGDKDDPLFRYQGRVSFDGYQSKPITLVGISLASLMQMYVKRTQLGAENMTKLYQLCVGSEMKKEPKKRIHPRAKSPRRRSRCSLHTSS